MSAPNNNDAPSMIGGHAQFAKGKAEEIIGNVTGNKDWQESAKNDTQAGIEAMKAANANRSSEPAASGIGGKIENLAGSAVGCEGMEKEGLVRQEKATETTEKSEGLQGQAEGLVKQDEPAK